MNTVTSFNLSVRQMTEMFQRPKCLSKKWPKCLSEKNRTIVLRNKQTTIGMTNICGSLSSYHIPQMALLHEAPDYIGAHWIKHAQNFYLLYSCLADYTCVIELPWL